LQDKNVAYILHMSLTIGTRTDDKVSGVPQKEDWAIGNLSEYQY